MILFFDFYKGMGKIREIDSNLNTKYKETGAYTRRTPMIKQRIAVPAVLLAACCLLTAGCKRQVEMYYDASEYAVEITPYGYENTQEVECCVVFSANEFYNYVGWRIVALRLFNPDKDTAISYIPEVYEARAGIANPDGLASRNAVPAEITSLNWKTIPLETPVTIEAATDYWAGYKVTALAGQYPLAAGAEPAYGNSYLSTGGGFSTVAGNWVVRIVLQRY